MRNELVEIYSDATNQAILRHPARQFPGVLIQGDTLWGLHGQIVKALSESGGIVSEDVRLELESVRDFLGECLDHYRSVLRDHDMKLPFVD